jgi:GNAT superfamily N-acetyltransferase
MSTKLQFTLQPLTPKDFDAISQIGELTSEYDPHTLLKLHGSVSYLRKDAASVAEQRKNFEDGISKPNRIGIKAVDSTGKVIGSNGIAYIGFSPEELAQLNPKESPAPQSEVSEAQTPESNEPEPVLDEKRKKAVDAIARLEEMEGADWVHWEKILRPEGSKSVVITGISVHPEYQGKGVGSALVKWATDKVDKTDTYIWVHSSEAGWRNFAKGGFEEIGRLDVDLDEWAKEAGDVEPPGGMEKWGIYTVRWMKRPIHGVREV